MFFINSILTAVIAKEKIIPLKDVVYESVGHGIETYQGIAYVGSGIRNHE